MVFDIERFYSKVNPPYQRKYNNIQQEPPKAPVVFTGASINGEIDAFYQQKAGDCKLLALLKSISLTDWGKKGIKKAVKPDGMGGAYVTFKGAKGEQKEFHITIEDFFKAENDGVYSIGDDDVLAIELAAVKYLKTQGIIVGEAGLQGYDVSKLGENELGTLLFGEDYQAKDYFIAEDIERILEIIEKEPGKYAATFGVILEMGENSYGHDLTLKGVEIKDGKKYVTFFDPHNSEDERMVDYNEFLSQWKCSIRLYGIDPKEDNRKLMDDFERTKLKFGLLNRLFPHNKQ